MKWWEFLSKKSNSIVVITIIFILMLVSIYSLKNLKQETDILKALPENIPAKKFYDHMEDIFPSKETIFLAYVEENPFTVENINYMNSLTERLSEIRGIYKVMSPPNAKLIYSSIQGLVVENMLNFKVQTEKDVQKFKQRLLNTQMYHGSLLGKDKNSMGFLLLLDKAVDTDKTTKRVVRFIHNENKEDKLFLSGKPIATYHLSQEIGPDMAKLFSVGFVVILLILVASFFTIQGVLFPLIIIVGTVLFTLAIMSITGKPITHSTEMMPILVLSIAVADSIHILNQYYINSSKYKQRKKLVISVYKELTKPVFYTSITSMVGFLALNTSRTQSLSDLGQLTALGIFIALVLTLSLLPALLFLVKVPSGRKKIYSPESLLSRLLNKYGRGLTKKPTLTLFLVVVIIAGLIGGITNLGVNTSTMQQFPKNHPVRKVNQVINSKFAGSTTFEVALLGNKKGVIKSPSVLKFMNNLKKYLSGFPHVGSVSTYSDYIKEMYKVLNEGQEEYYRIPQKKEVIYYTEVNESTGKETKEKEVVSGRNIIANLISLLEMSASADEFSHLVDMNYQNAKMTVFIDTDSSKVLQKIDNRIHEFITQNIQGLPLKAQTTGLAKLLLVVNNLVVNGQLMSLGVSLFLILIITALFANSLHLGVLHTFPLAFSILADFGIMGIFHIPLTLQTTVTTCVAIGVGVDFAIHFINRYKKEVQSPQESSKIHKKLFTETGRAIVINAVIVGLGFFSMFFSLFAGVSRMGLLISLTMFTAAWASLTILPPIFHLTGFKRLNRRREK